MLETVILALSSLEYYIKMSTKKYRFKKEKVFITVSFCICLFIGATLIIRSYLINNPIKINGKNDNNAGNEIRGEIKSFNIPNSPDVLSASNSNTDITILSAFPTVTDEKTYIQLDTVTKKYIGYLNKNLEFITLYKLNSSTTSHIKLYDTEAIIYVESNVATGETAIRYQTPQSEIFTLSKIDTNYDVVDFFYEPIESRLFYLLKDSAGDTYIKTTNFQNSGIDLYKSSLIKFTSIKYANNEELFLAKDKTCYKLNLKDKSVKDQDCINIPSNNENILFNIGETITPVTNFAQSLLKDNKTQDVYKFNDLESARNFVFQKGNIYFLSSYLGDNTATKIMLINLETLEVNSVALLQNVVISDYFILDNNFYVFCINNLGYFDLYRVNTDIDVGNYPASYLSGDILELQNIDIEKITHVSIIRPNYFFSTKNL